MGQCSLWDTKSMDEKYHDWKAQNPHIVRHFYANCNRYGNWWIKTGKMFGAKQVSEELRRKAHFSSNGDQYKLNNNYPSFLIRDWLKAFPQYHGSVELREQRS